MSGAFTQSLQNVLPELMLIAAACLQFLIGPFLVSDGPPTRNGIGRFWSAYAIGAFFAAAAVWQAYPAADADRVLGPFRSDPFVWFARGLTIISGIILVLINWDEVADQVAAELHGLILLIAAGIGLTAAANDLTVLFLALEFVSIPTYVLLYVMRRSGGTPEAATKYFLLSVFSSAILLYGFSFLYGVTGSTSLVAWHDVLAASKSQMSPSVMILAVGCVIAALSFRATAVPFHFYAPDVFQGSHPGAGALLAFLPKIVGFVALVRVLGIGSGFGVDSTGGAVRTWSESLFWIMAVASMFLGNLLALLQNNLKRLLAYSSISHAGYMLVGLAVGHNASSVDGLSATLFYLASYGITIAGVFGLLIYFRKDGRPIETVDDLAGLGQTHPIPAAVFTVLIFSLTGLPPTAGFLGKLNLLLAAWSHESGWTQVLAVVMVVNAAIAAGYYLRLVGAMYLRTSTHEIEESNRFPAAMGIGLTAAMTVGLFLFPRILWDVVDRLFT